METGISTIAQYPEVPANYQHKNNDDSSAMESLPRAQREKVQSQLTKGSSPTFYLTQKEVAGKFRVTESTVKNWREKGLLRYLRVSGSTRVLYPIESVEELEHQSLHQEKEVVRPKEIKRERPGISPRQQKEWRI